MQINLTPDISFRGIKPSALIPCKPLKRKPGRPRKDDSPAVLAVSRPKHHRGRPGSGSSVVLTILPPVKKQENYPWFDQHLDAFRQELAAFGHFAAGLLPKKMYTRIIPDKLIHEIDGTYYSQSLMASSFGRREGNLFHMFMKENGNVTFTEHRPDGVYQITRTIAEGKPVLQEKKLNKTSDVSKFFPYV